MRVRIASKSDYKELARVHWKCSMIQPEGFMYRLGLPFFVEYYRVMLREKHSLVLCAENEDRKIIGLVTGSLQSNEHFNAIKRNRIGFLLSSLLTILVKPALIQEILKRDRSSSVNEQNNEGFISLDGERLEYWGWLPDQKSTMGAVELLKKWLAIMKILGASNVRFEVDKNNVKSKEIHLLLGSKIIKTYVTPDNRERFLMEYSL